MTYKIFNLFSRNISYLVECDHLDCKDRPFGWKYKYVGIQESKTLWDCLEADGWSYDDRQTIPIFYCPKHAEEQGLKPGRFDARKGL